MKYLSTVALVIALGSTIPAIAQQDTTQLNQEVEVVKAYRPSISAAYKINELPEINDTTRFTPEFDYHIHQRPYTVDFETTPLSAARLNLKQHEPTGVGYLKVGAGTYNTPYADFFFNKPDTKTFAFGMRFRHLSSDANVKLREGKKVEAPFSQNNLLLFSKHYLNEATLSLEAGYNREVVNYYGYPEALPLTLSSGEGKPYGNKQRFQTGNFKATVASHPDKNALLKYKGGLHYSGMNTKTDQNETNFGVFGDFEYELEEGWVYVETAIDYFHTEGITNLDNPLANERKIVLVKINPSMVYEGEIWKFKAGLNLYTLLDDDQDAKLKLYPKLDAQWSPVADLLTLYVGADGYLKQNSYSAIAKENPWINPGLDVRENDYSYILSAGIRGKMNQQTSYNFGVEYTQVDDLHQYIMTGTAISPELHTVTTETEYLFDNRFDAIYANGNMLNLSADFSYVAPSDFYLNLETDFYHYDFDMLENESHLPSFNFKASSGFRVNDRIEAFADLNISGKRHAIIKKIDPLLSSEEGTTLETRNLDSYFAVNVGGTYQLPYDITGFVRIDNLFNQQSEKWLGYTQQRLRLMVGATWSF